MTESKTAQPADAPLAGIVIADFSRVLAGPLATMMLADLGADVIKIERPGQGDETRSWGPPYTTDGDSAYYLSVNRNKQSIALNLSDANQCSTAKEIALSADVVVENFRAGTMKRFGLDYDSLRAENPALVYCRISGFGNKKGRDLPGYDFLAQALSGLMSITGEPDRPPMKTGVAIVDVLTGLYAAIGIQSALLERQRTGIGQSIEVNLFSSAIASLVNQASSYLTTGIIPTRKSNQHPSIAPYETFATASESIVISVGNDGQFRNLCDAVDSSEFAQDLRWLTNADRVENRDSLVTALTDVLANHTHEHWLRVLKDHDVPSAPVNNISEAFELAKKLQLDPIKELVRVDGAKISTTANPIELSRTPVLYRRAPPTLDADSKDVLDELKHRRSRQRVHDPEQD